MTQFLLLMMVDVSVLMNFLTLLIPVALLQFGMQIIALIDLGKRSKVRYDSRLMWALIIILGGILGAAVYLITGRLEDDASSIS